ncbi:hypothetical protein T484DRAFT_1787431 [Baffinella frigidus]|nr:hypothetical protein T484DRAFT_1787431 [Cryptophyta sp. CCMP2293]
MSCSPSPPPLSPAAAPKKKTEGEDDFDLTGDDPQARTDRSPSLSLDSPLSADEGVHFGETDQERQDPDATPILASSEEAKVGPTGSQTAQGGSADSPVADHASFEEAKAQFEQATKEAKAQFEQATKDGNISGTLDFSATVLTHASSGVELLLLCLVFALKLPTLQEGFNLLSLGACCMVSAIATIGKTVVKEDSPWRVNFPGQDAGESATGFVNGTPVDLKFVSGTWELRKKSTKERVCEDPTAKCPKCNNFLKGLKGGPWHVQVCGLTPYRIIRVVDQEAAKNKKKTANQGDVNRFVFVMKSSRTQRPKSAASPVASSSEMLLKRLNAFMKECTALNSVVVPDDITDEDRTAFEETQRLAKIVFEHATETKERFAASANQGPGATNNGSKGKRPAEDVAGAGASSKGPKTQQNGSNGSKSSAGEGGGESAVGGVKRDAESADLGGGGGGKRKKGK